MESSITSSIFRVEPGLRASASLTESPFPRDWPTAHARRAGRWYPQGEQRWRYGSPRL